MLPVIMFIAFWAVLFVTVFFIAVRGGLIGARETFQSQSRTGRRIATLSFVAIYIGFGVIIPLAFLTGNHASASQQVAGVKLDAAERSGRELFGEHCAVCHTLAAANAIGKVGPNLDTLKPPTQLVLHTIQNGCLQNPPSPSDPQACLNQGNMPSGIVQGRYAQEVADFVGKVAGR